MPFYRQENKLTPARGAVRRPRTTKAEGTISYNTPQGAQVTVTFQSEEGNAFSNTVACFFAEPRSAARTR